MLKKFFCISFILLILSTSFVYAGEYDIMPLSDDSNDGEVFRDVQYIGFDENSSEHIVNYRIFNSGGKFEGTINIPDNMYKLQNWVLSCNSSGTVLFMRPYGFSNDCNFYIWSDGSNFRADFKHTNGTWGNVYMSIYNSSTNSWGTEIYNKSAIQASFPDLYPNCFLYCKGCSIFYSTNDTGLPRYAYDYFVDYRVLQASQLVYSNSGSQSFFRLFLGDFHVDSYDNDFFSIVSKLKSIYLFVYDLNTKSYKTQELNILPNVEEKKDSNGNYYVDISIENIIPYLFNSDGDYLISFAITLDSNKYVYSYSDLPASVFSNFHTLYSTIGYWRFQYDKTSKVGTLVPTDSEGNPTNPGGGEDNPTPEEDPNKGVIDGLGGVQNSIDNQTKAIEEQTEVNKNIFQQLLDLPRQAYSNVA